MKYSRELNSIVHKIFKFHLYINVADWIAGVLFTLVLFFILSLPITATFFGLFKHDLQIQRKKIDNVSQLVYFGHWNKWMCYSELCTLHNVQLQLDVIDEPHLSQMKESCMIIQIERFAKLMYICNERKNIWREKNNAHAVIPNRMSANTMCVHPVSKRVIR